MGVNNI